MRLVLKYCVGLLEVQALREFNEAAKSDMSQGAVLLLAPSVNTQSGPSCFHYRIYRLFRSYVLFRRQITFQQTSNHNPQSFDV